MNCMVGDGSFHCGRYCRSYHVLRCLNAIYLWSRADFCSNFPLAPIFGHFVELYLALTYTLFRLSLSSFVWSLLAAAGVRISFKKIELREADCGRKKHKFKRKSCFWLQKLSFVIFRHTATFFEVQSFSLHSLTLVVNGNSFSNEPPRATTRMCTHTDERQTTFAQHLLLYCRAFGQASILQTASLGRLQRHQMNSTDLSYAIACCK